MHQLKATDIILDYITVVLVSKMRIWLLEYYRIKYGLKDTIKVKHIKS